MCFQIQVWVRVHNSAIFEKIGFGCDRMQWLKNYYLYFLYISKAKKYFYYGKACKQHPLKACKTTLWESIQTTNDNKYISLLGKHANNIIFYIFSFFFFIKKGGARATICDLPPRAWPNRGTPSLRNVGVSQSYCDRDATDLTLAP